MNNNKLLIVGMIIAMILFLVTYYITEKYIITSVLCFVGLIILVNKSNKVIE